MKSRDSEDIAKRRRIAAASFSCSLIVVFTPEKRGAGNLKWYESNIKQILTNEKYIGDALLQKTYTVNTLDKKRVANNGIAPKYYVEGSHEAIIDKDVFLRVQVAVVTAINDAWARKDSVLPILKENIRAVIAGDTEAQLAEVDSEIKHLQTELLSVGNDQSRIDEIGDSIISLREERQAILSDAAARQGLRDRVNDLVSFLDEQTEAITEYSETPVRRLVEKITIFDEKITVAFKSKLKIDVDA